MTKNCDYGVKLPKNKLNLPTTKWNEDCPHRRIEVLDKDDEYCLDCGAVIPIVKRCPIKYFHDFRDVPCRACHVGGRLSWWWKVIKSWYWKI